MGAGGFRFVDSGGQIEYSGILARCCAWGLCVLTRTRLAKALRGEAGTGCRRREMGLMADFFPNQSPCEGQHA